MSEGQASQGTLRVKYTSTGDPARDVAFLQQRAAGIQRELEEVTRSSPAPHLDARVQRLRAEAAAYLSAIEEATAAQLRAEAEQRLQTPPQEQAEAPPVALNSSQPAPAEQPTQERPPSPQQPHPASMQQPFPPSPQQPHPASMQQSFPASMQQPRPPSPQQPHPASMQQPFPPSMQQPFPSSMPQPRPPSPQQPQHAHTDIPPQIDLHATRSFGMQASFPQMTQGAQPPVPEQQPRQSMPGQPRPTPQSGFAPRPPTPGRPEQDPRGFPGFGWQEAEAAQHAQAFPQQPWGFAPPPHPTEASLRMAAPPLAQSYPAAPMQGYPAPPLDGSGRAGSLPLGAYDSALRPPFAYLPPKQTMYVQPLSERSAALTPAYAPLVILPVVSVAEVERSAQPRARTLRQLRKSVEQVQRLLEQLEEEGHRAPPRRSVEVDREWSVAATQHLMRELSLAAPARPESFPTIEHTWHWRR